MLFAQQSQDSEKYTAQCPVGSKTQRKVITKLIVDKIGHERLLEALQRPNVR